jgi:hypothetical protein
LVCLDGFWQQEDGVAILGQGGVSFGISFGDHEGRRAFNMGGR